jgi:hypothetical protein
MAFVTISYAPGSWILIAGRDVNVLLPESEKQRAASVWAVIDSGAGFAEALDAIVSAGLAGLSAFALVADEDGLTRAVVRGDLRVELHTPGDTTVVAGTGTWAEQSLSDVEGVSVWAEPAGEQRLTLAEGLVRAAGFDLGSAIKAAEPAVSAPTAAPVLSLVPPAAPVALGIASTWPAEPADESEAAFEPDEDEPDFGEAAEEPLDAPELGEEPDDFGDSATDDFGALGILPEPETEPELAPGYGMAPPPAFPPPTHLEAASAPEPVHAPEPVAAPQPVRLAFSHGDNVEVTAPVVVGRSPHPDRFSHLVDPLVVRVPSPHQEISGTHVAISPDDEGGVRVTDLGSTNGTLIVRGGGAPEELRPGVGVSISRGDVIDLGDSLTIRVV